jgi:hypothetical protein
MKDAAEKTKKVYSKPVLSKYGDLTDLTTAASMSFSMKDGGPNNTKSN